MGLRETKSISGAQRIVNLQWQNTQTSGYEYVPGWNGTRVAGPNDGGVKRGDREDTGDNQADLDEMGSGPAEPTIDPTSLGGGSSIEQTEDGGFNSSIELDEQDGMEVMHEDDGRLGLTGTSGIPADDWAADTGATKNPQGE